MDVQELITNFLANNNIQKQISFKKMTPLQIYFQFEEITNKVIKEAEQSIKNNKHTIVIKDELETKEESIEENSDSDDICDLPANKALDLLDCETTDEENCYTSEELFSEEENSTDK